MEEVILGLSHKKETLEAKLADATALSQKHPDVPLQLILARLGFAPSSSISEPVEPQPEGEPKDTTKKDK